LTGWGDLDQAGLRLVSERLPGGGALGDRPEGLALARRRATLLRSLCDAASSPRRATARCGSPRSAGSSSTCRPPPSSASFAAWWEGVDWGHRWPAVAANADAAAWRRALWSAALAPLAMLGAVDVPALLAPTPAWFAVTATAPALLAAATAMTGPEAPPALAVSAQN
jgi:hypothetical protein